MRQQHYRVQSFNRAVVLLQTVMQLQQGVVTYTSPIEVFVTGIKNFDR